MISMLTYSSVREELELIEKISRRNQPLASGDKWFQEYYRRLNELRERLAKEPIIDILCYDIVAEGSHDYMKRIREYYDKALLMVIAEETTPPDMYVNPYTRATSLLLRPSNEEEIDKKINEVFSAYNELTNKKDDDVIIVDTHDGRTRIPQKGILYIESYEKKMHIVTSESIYGTYETFDSMQKKLNNNFIRCHRCYIVNKKRIESVLISKGEIKLTGGDFVPLSRTYKNAVKELMGVGRD